MKTLSEVRSDFARGKYAVLRDLVSDAARAFLYEYALKAAEHGKMGAGDPQVPGTPCRYGDPFMESLLERVRPRLEAESGLRLYPTYSYFRVYKRGDALGCHQDRESCEISVTLSLGQRAAEAWPIWVKLEGAAAAVKLEPGEAMLYKGMEVPHWREVFTGEHAAQVFLHYVNRDGPHREWKFDMRPALGTLPPVEQIMEQLQPSIGATAGLASATKR